MIRDIHNTDHLYKGVQFYALHLNGHRQNFFPDLQDVSGCFKKTKNHYQIKNL